MTPSPSSCLHLYNTLTKRVEPFRATDPARVTFYTCGPTVYDDAHIGNFRAFLIADLLRRWIESPLCHVQDTQGNVHAGPRSVRHAMNITDVGHMTDDSAADGGGQDKMDAARSRLLEAKKAGTLPAGTEIDAGDPMAIARFYSDRFLEDARRLGLRVAHEPDMMPRATAYVPAMIALIERLIARGCAYVSGPAGGRAVYFSVHAFESYGRLSGNTLEALRAGAGGRVDDTNQQAKRHPADFLLWKEDAAHLMKWSSPWGQGYPGWHVECSAMAFEVLARAEYPDACVPDGHALIDLHTGGEDNIFPHHECEIAQSCCAFNETPAGAPFARHWLHTRFLLVDGQKMSKSKGNFFTARDLFARGVEPAALRLALVRTHYRTNADFTEQLLKDSQRMVERWRRIETAHGAGAAHPASTQALAAFSQAMHDDLNIAAAIAAINTMAGELTEPTRADADILRQIDGVLGVLSLERPASADTTIGIFAPGIVPEPAIMKKLEQRRAARASKDFAASDAIRDELAAMGYAIKDVAGGRVEVTRL
ncbi:MAG: cysteine--tRNA ligase [Phycisphaeraceae bacterium]|nr:cysteine--tRNA ligase [Phycisphaeraceae bacterium]